MIDWEQTSSVKNPTQEDEEYQRVEKMINDAMDEAEKLASQEQKKKSQKIAELSETLDSREMISDRNMFKMPTSFDEWI